MGGAERAVQEVKAHSKILIADLLEKCPGLPMSSSIFQWAPRHAAASISRYRILDCGRTAEELRCGRRWKRPVVLFGETAHFQPAGARPRGALNTIKGVFAGMHERTGSCMFLTPSGCRKGTRIVRLPAGERYPRDFISSCLGYPWDLKGVLYKDKTRHHLRWLSCRFRAL